MTIVSEELWTKRDFIDLARRQQQFVGIFALILIANIAAVSMPGQQALFRGLATLLSLASLYFVYKLVAAVLPASSTWIIVAYFVLSFMPFVNLLLLGYLNSLATKRLRLTGLSAGLLGARISDLEKLDDTFSATVVV